MRPLLLLALLPGCSLLFDPDDHIGGDAGTRADASTIDAPGMDAPGIDAPGIDAPRADAPFDAGRACPVTHSGYFEATASPALPSVTIDGPTAFVGVVADNEVFVNRYSLPDMGLSGSESLTDTIVSRPVTAPTSVAIRRIESQLAFIITGPTDSSAAASGVWVGYGENVTNLGTGAPRTETQLGPVGISGGPTPRYFWNQSGPERLIGSLEVRGGHGAETFRRLSEQLPASPAHLDVSAGSMIVATAADPNTVLVWNGDGPDNATSGALEMFAAPTGLVGPAIAALDANHYAIVSATSDALVVFVVRCAVTAATQCTIVARPTAFDIPAPPRALAASGIGNGLVIASAHTNDEVSLTIMDGALTMSDRIRLTVDGLATDALDVDTALVAERWAVVVAQLDRANLLLSHVCLPP